VKDLSLSFDYYDNTFTDGFGGIASLMDRQLFAANTISRGPKLASDPAAWLGPITGFDGRIINIAGTRSTGYSFGVRYQRSTRWGEVTANVIGERTLVREERILPNSLPTASVNKKFSPARVTGSLFWSRGAWEAGVTTIYGGQYWVDSSNSALKPSAYTDPVQRWDVNAGYDLSRRPGFGTAGESWWRRALRDTKLRATIINLGNTEPPLTVNGAFSTSVIDMRLRRYILDVTKRF
jgi:hypothetical protein